MKRDAYPIPENSRCVIVESDIETGTLIISFSKSSPSEFYCAVTEHLEYSPSVGDLCILWDDERPSSAIISLLQDWERGEESIEYIAENEFSYKNAVRFRDEEQYRKILNYGKK